MTTPSPTPAPTPAPTPYPVVPKRYLLLPPYMGDNPAWSDITNAMDQAWGEKIDDPISWISQLRNTFIVPYDTLVNKSAEYELIDTTNDLQTFEREILIKQANMLGLNFSESDLLDNPTYTRITRFLGQYWFNKGTPDFINFLGFVLDGQIEVTNLWSTAGITYGTYGPFLPVGDPGIGTPVWQGGEWFQTTHVQLTIDPSTFSSSFTLDKLIALFNAISNYNLVLQSIILQETIYIHPVDNLMVSDIVLAYPSYDIEEVITTTTMLIFPTVTITAGPAPAPASPPTITGVRVTGESTQEESVYDWQNGTPNFSPISFPYSVVEGVSQILPLSPSYSMPFTVTVTGGVAPVVLSFVDTTGEYTMTLLTASAGTYTVNINNTISSGDGPTTSPVNVQFVATGADSSTSSFEFQLCDIVT